MSRATYQEIDTVYRIYKNSLDKTIGIHEIVVVEERPSIPDPIPGHINDNRFQRRGVIKSSFRRIINSMGEDRVIAKISFIGNPDDFTYNDAVNDLISITYNGTELVNDLIIPLVNFPTVGDTL